MNITDTLKEYFVSIGFKIDDFSLDHTQKVMDSVEGLIKDFAGSSTLNFAKAAAGIITFLVDINIGLAKFMAGLGQADLQTQIFAQKTGLSVDKARAYQSSLSALGASQEDLNSSPELRQRFFALQQQALQMQIPAQEYEPAMKSIRDMAFEFQRLKLEGMDALQWIGYYLLKDVEPVLEQSGISLKDINDNIQKNMPQWAEKIAQIASWFVRLGAAAWDARGIIAGILEVFGAPTLLSLATNPLFLLIAGLSALLVLIADYKAYESDQSGNSSLFSELWKSLDDNGVIANLKQGFDDILGSLEDLLSSIGDLVQALDKSGALHAAIMFINSIFKILGDTLESIAGLVTIVAGALRAIATGNLDTLHKGLDMFINGVPKGFADSLNEAMGTGNTSDDNIPEDNFTRAWKQYQKKKQEDSKSVPEESDLNDYRGSLQQNGGIAKSAFFGNSGASFLSYPSRDLPQKDSGGSGIYDLLATYLPPIASSLGLKFNPEKENQSDFRLSELPGKIRRFYSDHQTGFSVVNYLPISASNSNYGDTHNSNQVSVQSNYNIYGASDPNTTAKVIDASQTQLLTRTFRGVLV